MGGTTANLLLVSIIVQAIDRFSGPLRAMGLTGLGSFGSLTMGAAAVAAALAAIGIASIGAASGFDQAMHKVMGLTTLVQQSGKGMQYWEDQLLAMAPQVDVAPTKLAQALYFVASAGIPANQVLDVLRYTAMAAAATMGDMKQTADLVTSAMNAYKNQGLSAAHATDVIVDAIRNGKVEMHALQASFAFVATQGMAAKFTIEEVAAAVSTLTQVSGNTAARRVQMDLDNLMRRLGDPQGIATTAKKLRLPFDEAKFASSGLIDRLKMLMNMSGFTTSSLAQLRAEAHGNEQQFEKLALQAAINNHNFQLLAGGAAAMIPSVILLNDKGKTFTQILNEMTHSAGETQQAFDVMRQSTGQKWNMLKTAISSILTLIGLQLLPVVNAFLDVLYKVGTGLVQVLSTVGGMQTLKYALLGIAIVTGAVLLPILMSAIGALFTFLAPILAVVAAGIALGLVIRAVVAHFGGWAGVMKALHPILAQIGKLFNQAGAEIRKALADPQIQRAWKQLQAALPQIIPLLKVLAVIVGVQLYVAFQLAVGFIRLAIGQLAGFFTVIRGVIMVLGGLGQLITDIFTGKWSHIGADLKQIGAGLLTIVQGLFQSMLGGLGGFIGHFLELFGTSGDKVKSGALHFVQGIGTAIANFFTIWIPSQIKRGVELWLSVMLAPFRLIGALFSWLYNHNTYVKRLVDMIHQHLIRLRDWFVWGMTEVRSLLTKAWQTIQAEASAAWTWVYAHIIKPVQDAIAWFMGVNSRIQSAIHDHVVKPIEDAISSLVQNALHWGENLLKMFIQGMKNQLGALGNAAKGVIKTVGGWLGFHSPAPRVPESAQWGPNLIRMFAAGMVGASPVAGAAAAAVIARVAGQLAGRGPGAGAGGGLGNAVGARVINNGSLGSLAGMLGAGAGGPTTVTHNWAGAFPNATSKDEIVAAIREVQQNDYRAGRRPGSYGGLGVHTSIR